MQYIENYMENTIKVINLLTKNEIKRVVEELLALKQRQFGRLFIIGVGGSAANASHAVNDFRKIAGIEAYTPTDNVSELTAITNDRGWEYAFVDWLIVSKLNKNDLLLVFSVGGGSEKTSKNIVNAIVYAKHQNANVIGIVSRDGGFTKKHADTCILIPTVNKKLITPIAESLQAVIWHLLATHPDLIK